MKKHLPCILDDTVEKYLASFGTVCIDGSKWCGNTYTCSLHSQSEVSIGDSANNIHNRHLAEIYPDPVLSGAAPRLIDV